MESLATYRLDNEDIDIAFIPNWALLDHDGRNNIDQYIRPEQIIPTFMFPYGDDLNYDVNLIKTYYPNAIIFTQSMEKKSIE